MANVASLSAAIAGTANIASAEAANRALKNPAIMKN